MMVLEKINAFIRKLTTREFQIYSIILISAMFLLIITVDFKLYRSSRRLYKKITILNDEREEQVKEILARGAQIKQQKEEMNRILSEDLDFKIAGYFNTVLKKLNLAQKKVTEIATQNDIDALYRESTLQVRLSEMDMKQLTELLQVFEANERISIKQLEIIASTKKPNTIEVQLTLTTMLLKAFGES